MPRRSPSTCLNGLTNARDRRDRFKVRLFDPDQPNGVYFEFALLRGEPQPDSTVGYRLTQEAIELHLSLLAHDRRVLAPS